MSTLQATNLKHASSASNNVVLDASGNAAIAGNLSFNSGYGSSAIGYGCRAWVNFNGTGTVSIRASGNVSSITDGGIGRYVINMANAMPDANYVFSIAAQNRDGNDDRNIALMAERKGGATRTSSALHIDAGTWLIGGYTGTPTLDPDIINVAIFR